MGEEIGGLPGKRVTIRRMAPTEILVRSSQIPFHVYPCTEHVNPPNRGYAQTMSKRNYSTAIFVHLFRNPLPLFFFFLFFVLTWGGCVVLFMMPPLSCTCSLFSRIPALLLLLLLLFFDSFLFPHLPFDKVHTAHASDFDAIRIEWHAVSRDYYCLL